MELGRTIRKLENKLRGNYANSLARSINTFYLEPFVKKEVKEVYAAMASLKGKIFEYINEFCDSILKQNIDHINSHSLFHYTN